MASFISYLGSRTSDPINIVDFGASTGSANNKLAILAAALEAANRGVFLYVPVGTFVTDPLDLSAIPGLEGEGWRSIIQLRAQDITAVGDHGLVEMYGTSGTNLVAPEVRNICLDGNKANITGTKTLNMEGLDIKYWDGGRVDNVLIKNTISEGFDVDLSTGITLSSNTALGCGGNGYHLSNGAVGNKLIGNTADGCGFDWNRSGFDQYDGSSPEGDENQYVGNVARDNYRNYNILGDSAGFTGNLSYGTTSVEDVVSAASLGYDPFEVPVTITPSLDGFDFPQSFTQTIEYPNGILNYLGTQGYVASFSNPAVDSFRRPGFITTTQSTTNNSSQEPENAFSGTPLTYTATTDTANSWWQVDFGEYRVTSETIGLVGRSEGAVHLRNFTVAESNDGSTWTTIYTATDEGPETDAWAFITTSSPTPSRYLRITQTGANSSGSDFLTIGELEIWGTIALDNPPFDPWAGDRPVPFHSVWAEDSTWTAPADGDPVSSWRNESGGGDPVETGSNRPTYRASTAAFNGQPTVEFVAASNQRLYFNIPNVSQPYVLVGVGSFSTAANPDILTSLSDDTSHGIGKTSGNAWTINQTVSGGVSDTDPHVLVAVFNGASSELFVDGVSVATGTISGGTFHWSIGAAASNSSTFSSYLDGHVAFIGAYSKGSRDSEIIDLETDLMTHYGI